MSTDPLLISSLTDTLLSTFPPQIYYVTLVVAAVITISIFFFIKKTTTTSSSTSSKNKLETPPPSAKVVATIEKLFVYPIKSCGGIELTEAKIGIYGFLHDRKWVLAHKRDGYRFVNQRQYPRMTFIKTSFHDDYLHIDAPDMPTLRLPLEGLNLSGPYVPVGIWKDKADAIDEGDTASEWFNSYIKPSSPIRLFRYSGARKAKPRYHRSDANNLVTFTDRNPYLLINQKSIDALNEMVQSEGLLTVTRFRPNILVSAEQSWEEDSWEKINIGCCNFHVVCGCDRCKIPTINPETAKVSETLEPLVTINKRPNDPKIFGQMLMHTKASVGKTISVGMKVYLISIQKKKEGVGE